MLGWSVADHMLTELVTDALAQAVAVRGGQVGGTIMHSDRGTQYTARAMVQACAGRPCLDDCCRAEVVSTEWCTSRT